MIDPSAFVLKFIFDFWWFLFPVLLFQILWEKYKNYRKTLYRQTMEWSFLELQFPRGISRSPKAMEEVFNALHAIAPDTDTDITWFNLNIRGFIPKSYVFLLIAHDRKLRFFIRFPKQLKEFIKSRFYSQYPEIKFSDVDDPLNILPTATPNSLFDAEIFDVRLNKEDAYPIKTFTSLEYLPKEQQIDQLMTFSEGAWQISNKEWLVFQIFVLPTTSDNEEYGKEWVKRGQKIVNKLIGKKEEEQESIWKDIEEFIKNLLIAPFKIPVWSAEENKEKEAVNIQGLTPGERKTIEFIQQKLSKLGFLCNIRITYVATKDIFADKKNSIISLISSTLKNFSTEDLNGFTIYPLGVSYFRISPLRNFLIKRREFAFFKLYLTPQISQNYQNKLKERNLDKSFILNSEELASIFHPPMEFVPPTSIERIPVKELPPSSEIPFTF